MRVFIYDFGASLTFTHHTQYILSQVNFIKRNFQNATVTVFLPIGSQIDSNTIGIPHKTIKLLLPITHFANFHIARWQTFFLVFWRKIYKVIFFDSNKLLLSRIQKCIKVSLIFPHILFLSLRPDSLIIFPTACPQALFLTRCLELFHTRQKIHVRFGNTSEVRAPFGSKNLVIDFLRETQNYTHVKLICSFETIMLLEEYSAFVESSDFIYSRPPNHIYEFRPPLNTSNTVNRNQNNPITLLILGRSHDLNRQEFLEKTLIDLKSQLSDTPVKIYLTTNPKRIEYVLSLHTPTFQIEIVPYKEPLYVIQNLLARANLLILLYNTETYRFNHSAMFLMACDLKTPIIVGRGMSFSEELEKYKLGGLYSSQDNLVNLVFIHLSNSNIVYGFSEYSLVREIENIEILSRLGF